MKKNEYENKIIGKAAIAVGILFILVLIPFTRTAIMTLSKFIGGLALWIILLFVVIFLIRWLILPTK